ncbi:MAG: hypothetical protein LBU90_06550 [Bacteroidales bacterium]|jgi:endo-1,4-beta-D-glucanase Y|nr:hypothetical protein [Bacteroidales bacterium]
MKKLCSLFLACAFATALCAQSPFPFGYTSPVMTAQTLDAAYARWREGFVRTCEPNELRVVNPARGRELTVSEGIGYGLVISAYMNNKSDFDKLLNYYRARLNERGFMNWEYFDCDTGDNQKNAAADADLDVAIALMAAMVQWGDAQYKKELDALLSAFEKYYFVNCDGVLVLKPGDMFGSCTCTNPSYYSPAYYRAFARYAETQKNKKSAQFWEKVVNDTYIVLLRHAHPYTGLIFAWTNAEGGDPTDCGYQVAGSGTYNSFQYDACRMPWRIATDYVWWGDSRAKQVSQRLTNFVNEPVWQHKESDGTLWFGAGGIRNVVDGYYVSGLRKLDEAGNGGRNHTIPFVGGFALASMAVSQTDTDAFMLEYAGMTPQGYYATSLDVLYKLVATGRFWNPAERLK